MVRSGDPQVEENMMHRRLYTFEYTKGGSKPSKTIQAASDEEARTIMRSFLIEVGGNEVAGSLVGHEYNTWIVPDFMDEANRSAHV